MIKSKVNESSEEIITDLEATIPSMKEIDTPNTEIKANKRVQKTPITKTSIEEKLGEESSVNPTSDESKEKTENEISNDENSSENEILIEDKGNKTKKLISRKKMKEKEKKKALKAKQKEKAKAKAKKS